MRPMLGRLWSVERAVHVLGIGTLLWAAVAGRGSVGDLLHYHPRLVLVYLAALALGEMGRVTMPGGRITAPVATASAMALPFTVLLSGESPFTSGTSLVVLVASLGSVLGLGLRRLWRREIAAYLVQARILGTAVVAALARELAVNGTSLWQWQLDPSRSIPLVAGAMVAISAVGVYLEVFLAALVRAEREHVSARAALRDDLGEAQAVTVSLVTAGPLAALLSPVLGLTALPFALFPMVLTYVAVQRFTANQATFRQMIATLSRLTEAGGYTPTAHAERVAALSMAMGRYLGLIQRELRDLEYAALLHDLGQIALREPIPGGATVLAAPHDQHRIAANGAGIVRRAGVLDDVAALVEVQATPYRIVRELGQDVPLASRIIKVANAFDDLTGGQVTSATRERAMERINLGLGYEYDPAVVDALAAAVRTHRRGSKDQRRPGDAPARNVRDPAAPWAE